MELQGEISSNINTLDRHVHTLQAMISPYEGSDKSLWNVKVENEAAAIGELRESLVQFMSNESKVMREKEEREELFQRVRGSRYDHDADSRNRKDSDSLAKSMQQADEIIETGGNILGSLHEQREMLKGIKRKVLSITSTLGLTRSLMTVIQKRQVRCIEQLRVLTGGWLSGRGQAVSIRRDGADRCSDSVRVLFRSRLKKAPTSQTKIRTIIYSAFSRGARMVLLKRS